MKLGKSLMEKRPCPTCSEGILIPKWKSVSFTYEVQQYEIPDVLVYVCNTCDEEVIQAKEVRRMESIARQKRMTSTPEPAVDSISTQ